MWREITCLASLILLLGAVNSALAAQATNPYPTDGATHGDTWVTLSWQAGAGAVLHNVYFGDSFDDVNSSTDDTFLASQDSTTFVVGFPGFAFPDGLVQGITYYWRIDEVNDADPASPWRGDIWSFTISLQQGQGQRASNPSPADEAVVEDVLMLEWIPGDTAVAHKVYLSTDAIINESDLVAETYMSLVAVALDPGRTYYWRVDEVEEDGSVIEGVVWSFTTLPLEAHLPDPFNGATNVAVNAILSWSRGKGAIMHDMYFGTDVAAVSAADPSTFMGKLMVTSFDPGPLEPDTVYYWRVDEFALGVTNPGPVWNFITIGFIGGVKAEYFAGKIPQGIPCRTTQIEPNIDHNWSSNEVPCGLSNGISARWTADLVIPVSNTYTFYTTSEDGVRLYLDHQRIIDNWTDSSPGDQDSPPLALIGGQRYPLVMEWFDNGGSAVAQLSWETPTMQRQIIPSGSLQPPINGEIRPVPVFEAGDFEYFTDDVTAHLAIFQTWIGNHHPDDPDLTNDNDTGMIVGNLNPPYAEKIIVYSGEQSMPLRYDNTLWPYYSQADRTWDTPQDWITEDIVSIHMQIHGRPQNDPEPFYIRIEDTAGRYGVVFHPDPDVLKTDGWVGWGILLSEFEDFGVDMTRVKKMSIGMGRPPVKSNDDWRNAMPIGNVTNLTFDTTEATIDGPEVCMRSKNIWYCYNAPYSGRATISLCGSSFDTKLAVYEGYGSAPTWAPSWDNLLQYRDDFCDYQSQVAIPVTAGQKYLIEVGGYDINRFGQGILNITCDPDPPLRPYNDDWFNAERVYSLIGLDADTTGATKDGPGDCVEGFNIWYWYKATSTDDVTITLDGAGSYVELAVYEGRDNFPLYESRRIVCENLDEVTFDVVDGQDYLIEVGGPANGYFALTSGSNDDCYNAKLIGNVTDLTFDTSKAGPVGPILSNSPTVAQLGKKVYDISYKTDLPSQILSDGPKLLDNHEPEPGGDGKAIIDQVILAGAKPGILWGYLKDDSGKGIPNATVTLVLQTLKFWGETRNDEGLYKVDAIQGDFQCTVTKDNLSAELSPQSIDDTRVKKILEVPQNSWRPN